MISIDRGPRFPLGRIVITPNAMQQVVQDDIIGALRRHCRGDWGEMDAHDQNENELSVKAGFRILSAYRARNGTKFWIITEADRSVTTIFVTTILLPEDY